MIGGAGRASVVMLERVIMWMYGPRAPWPHVFFGGFAASWAIAHLFNPAELDRGTYAAIQWLPDGAWIAAYLGLAALHLLGVWRPAARRLRALACLGSAWVWIVLGLTFAVRNGLTPGAMFYTHSGIVAVGAALYIAWREE